MSILIVGHSPVPGSPGDRGIAFVGTDSGERLARYAGMESSADLLDVADCVNLLPHESSPTDSHSLLRRRMAIEAAWVDDDESPVRRLLLCGGLTHAAFGFQRPVPMLEWRLRSAMATGTLYEAACVPHPSGQNRWWNDLTDRLRAQAFLRRELRPAPTRQDRL